MNESKFYFLNYNFVFCFLLFNVVCLVPDEFQYDPISKSFGDVTRRPEVKASTIEFIAPSEYMVSIQKLYFN